MCRAFVQHRPVTPWKVWYTGSQFRYEKRRTPWRFGDPARPLVVVDETPLGLFAEIEGEAGAVRALAAELGVAEESFLRASYLGLWQAAREAEPDLPEDMVFPE